MIDCHLSSDCVGCVFASKCLIQIGLNESEESLKAMVGMLIDIPIGCEVYEKVKEAA